MMQILDFLSLRNLLSNELFFAFCEFAIASFFNLLKFTFLSSLHFFIFMLLFSKLVNN